MTRAEIEEISEVVSEVERYSFKTDREKIWYKIGCVNGLKVADAKPNLESLWHDASEEPKEYPIIYQDEFSDVWILRFSLKDFVDGWEDFIGFECVTRWAYIKDLLPKGGKL